MLLLCLGYSEHGVAATLQEKPSKSYSTPFSDVNPRMTAWWRSRSGLHELSFFPGRSPHMMAALSIHEVLLKTPPCSIMAPQYLGLPLTLCMHCLAERIPATANMPSSL